MSDIYPCNGRPTGTTDYVTIPEVTLAGDFTISSISIFEVKRVKMKKRGPLKNRYCNVKFGTVFLWKGGEDAGY